MYNHAPENYQNPFAAILKGEFDNIRSNEEDVFYKDEYITAFISAGRWPNNPGNALVIPNEEYENIYDIPDDLLARIHIFSKRLAIAMKEVYECEGVSFRQHNEPAGNQEVWHYHLHVFPRYDNDDLYILYKNGSEADPDERAEYAAKLRDYFQNN